MTEPVTTAPAPAEEIVLVVEDGPAVPPAYLGLLVMRSLVEVDLQAATLYVRTGIDHDQRSRLMAWADLSAARFAVLGATVDGWGWDVRGDEIVFWLFAREVEGDDALSGT